MPANSVSKRLRLAALAALLLGLVACSEENKPVRGFVLPQGDSAQGEQVFLDFGCHSCHTISGVELPKPDFEAPFILELGGEVHRVKNYGDLLTSVVNPDHIISPTYVNMLNEAGRDAVITPMPNFREHMTVAELTDLVEFLHGQYTRLQPQFYRGFYLTD